MPPSLDGAFADAMQAHDLARAAALLAQGANVDVVITQETTFDRDIVEETHTPLLAAASYGNVDDVRFLLERGANPNFAASYSGRTPLTSAAYFGYDEIVGLLLQHGADVAIRERFMDQSAMDCALGQVKAGVVRRLLAAGGVPTFGRLNFSIDGGAAAREIVQMLVAHGVAIDTIDDWGYTPLMWAASYADLETVRLIIQLGADVNRASATNMNGVNSNTTALRMARKERRRDVVELLKQHGATESLFERFFP